MSGVATTSWALAPSPRLIEAKRNASMGPPLKQEHRSHSLRIRRQKAFGSGIVSSWDVSSSLPDPSPAAEERVNEVVSKQAALARDELMRERRARLIMDLTKLPAQAAGGNGVLATSILEAHKKCAEVCAKYDKIVYWGAKLMSPERQRAIVALTVWCRRTDQLVDGPAAAHFTREDMEAWEERLQDVFHGRPHDLYDLALVDTISKYPIDIQLFKDLITGMSLDMWKTRYMNFDELYLYGYYVAGTAAIMFLTVLGIAPESKASTESIYKAAVTLGVAGQLTNILRDVGEDARRGRIYLPLDELERAGLSEDDIYCGIVTDKWRKFMKEQVKRARKYYAQAEMGMVGLSAVSRWPAIASLLMYSQILDAIEANDYNNFTKRADVGQPKRLLSLAEAYRRVTTGLPQSFN